MHAISSYRDNRPTNKQTQRQDRLQYTVPQLARSVITTTTTPTDFLWVDVLKIWPICSCALSHRTPSVLWRCGLGNRKSIPPVKILLPQSQWLSFPLRKCGLPGVISTRDRPANEKPKSYLLEEITWATRYDLAIRRKGPHCSYTLSIYNHTGLFELRLVLNWIFDLNVRPNPHLRPKIISNTCRHLKIYQH